MSARSLLAWILGAIWIVALPAFAAQDCNKNGIPDYDDIRTRTSLDRDHNLVPDECDLVLPGIDFETPAVEELETGSVLECMADIDRDGVLDVLLRHEDKKWLTILAGGGDGTFRVWSKVFFENVPVDALAGDFNGDGRTDLAVSLPGAHLVRILLSGGFGMFREGPVVSTSSFSPMVAGDFDGDGRLDVAGMPGYEVCFRFQERTGEFTDGPSIPTGYAESLCTGDIDADGKIDLLVLVVQGETGVVHGIRNLGRRSFELLENPPRLGFCKDGLLAAGDLDGDGDTDVALLLRTRRLVATIVQLGSGRWASPRYAYLGGTIFPNGIAAGDVNGDRMADVVLSYGSSVSSGGFCTLLSQGDGILSEPAFKECDPTPRSPAVADLDGDGDLDLCGTSADYRRHAVIAVRATPGGFLRDCDRNGVLDSLEPDCDGDGEPDVCQVAGGRAIDSNRNGVPDFCEPDCNRNGIPDAAELALHALPDCNRNGVPDGCDISAQLRMRTDPKYPCGEKPWGVAAGDLDGDGDLDVVSVSYVSLEASLLWNRGDGFFSKVGRLRLSSIPQGVALEDLEGDGDVDLFVNQRSAPILLFKNIGGQFLAPIEIDLGMPLASGLAVGDLDADGLSDLVIRGEPSFGLFVMWNRWHSFSAPVPISGFSINLEAILFDLDRDGDLDVLAISNTDVLFVQNLGLRQFASPVALTGQSGHPVPGDYDGDGDYDLLVVGPYGSCLVRASGHGRFLQPVRIPGFTETVAQAIAADVDSDGHLDVVVLRGCRTYLGAFSTVGIFRNLGEGAFAREENSFIPAATGPAAFGDFDGDGDMDAVLPDFFGGAVVFAENRLGRIGAHPSLCLPYDTAAVVLRDFDKDGIMDIVALAEEGVWMIRGAGGRSFQDPVFAEVGVNWAGRDIVPADLDLDGDLDVLAVSPPWTIGVFDSGILTPFLNVGGVSFAVSPPIAVGEEGPYSAVAADFDSDGDVDVAVGLVSGFAILWNVEGGFFDSGERIAVALRCPSLTAVDPDLDGDWDVAAADSQGKVVSITNLGGGMFEENPVQQLDQPRDRLFAFEAADLNGDGREDLGILAERVGIYILLAGPDGTYLPAGSYALALYEQDMAFCDLDGDGDEDIVTVARWIGPEGVLVRLNDGAGRFSAPLVILDQGGDSISPGDADGDGDIDLLVVDEWASGWILINESRAASRDEDRDGIPDECGRRRLFHRGDPNGDAALDISDALFTLGFLFTGGSRPACLESADANGDGALDISDAIALLNYLFLGGPPPAYPGPVGSPCGPDTDPPGSPGDLGCDFYEGC